MVDCCVTQMFAPLTKLRASDGVLRVNGKGGTDISVAIDDVNKTVDEIFAAVARHRPDLLPAGGRLAAA